MTIYKPSSFDGLFGPYLNSVVIILEEFSGDGISGPENIALFTSEFIDLLGNKLPKAFKVQFSFVRLFQVKFVFWEWRRNHAFVFCVFEIDDIMGLNFAFELKILQIAVQYEFPIAFALVLVDYRYSFIYWLFNQWPLIDVLFLNAVFLGLNNLIVFI